MSGPYSGFVEEQRDDSSSCRDGITSGPHSGFVEEQRCDSSSPRDTSSSSAIVIPSYGFSGGGAAVAKHPGRRLFGAISKDLIRTFQTTIQKNGRSQQMMPENAPVSNAVRPPLQKIASEGNRMANSMQRSVAVDGVGGKLSSANDKLGVLCRSAGDAFAGATRSDSDRGIYSGQSTKSWGSAVSAEISSFATQKVVPFFGRQNTYPIGSIGSHSKVHNAKEVVVSFDYQLMKDNE